MDYKRFIEDRPHETEYLGGGTINTMVSSEQQRLTVETKHYGNHTTITNLKKWKKRRRG